MTLTIRHPLATGLGLSLAAVAGWAAARVASIPDFETGDAPQLVDELTQRRIAKARQLHPSHPTSLEPFDQDGRTYVDLNDPTGRRLPFPPASNVVPFRTPDQAS